MKTKGNIFMLNTLGQKARLTVALGLCAAMISGCTVDSFESAASSSGSQVMAFQDNCTRFRQPFEQIRAERDKIIGQNVAGGALIGAVTALALGGDAKDAMAAAVVGGLAGAANAYAQNAASRGATEASLRSFANRDALNEKAQNDRLVRTIVQINACRLDQADDALARASRGEITPAQAKSLLDQIEQATRADNRAIQRVGGFGKTYEAYVGVLDRDDVRAAQATRRSVASYKPKVSKVNRTSRGSAAIAPQSATGATPVAQAENSRNLIRTSATAHQESVSAGIAERRSRLDSLIPDVNL